MPDIDALFKMLLDEGGSDLHLASHRKPMIRESGTMRALDLPESDEKDVEHFLSEIIPGPNMSEFKERSDTDFAYEIPGVARFRCNAYRDRRGVGAVFRVIPATVLSAEQLKLPRGITNFCYLSKGLVVVTGPTGSGKSTTLAAMVDLVNRTRSDHVITIEDPIEFVHQEKQCRITQREVGSHTKSFASALRAALRQDPDVVMVGELRDLETIEIAIETAETGHLVFGTLHTNTAYSTVDRIIDAFPSDRQNQIRTMLAASLKGVVAQTLCRRLGGGRVAALEVLVVDRAVAALIRDGRTFQIPSVMQTGRSRGMMLLNDSLVQLVADGAVDAKEAYVKSVEKDELLQAYRKSGIDFEPETLTSPE
jgi:twitching motility protein PilT